VAGNDPSHADNGEHRVALEGTRDVRDPLPPELRDPTFPASVRGYDRRAVDTYVERVNGLIAELQVSGSPRAAVRHALDRVGEQTAGILQRARETAEEITTGAREEAEETTGRARAEAEDVIGAAERKAADTTARGDAEASETVGAAQKQADEILTGSKDEAESIVARARAEAEGRFRQATDEIDLMHRQAEERLRSLQADFDSVTEERRTLLDEVRRVATRLTELVGEAEPAPAEEKAPEPVAVAAEAMTPAAADGNTDGDKPAEDEGRAPDA
jgi:cell division septum initiation protein DivIVA